MDLAHQGAALPLGASVTMSERGVLWPALCRALAFWKGEMLQERWVFGVFWCCWDVAGIRVAYDRKCAVVCQAVPQRAIPVNGG